MENSLDKITFPDTKLVKGLGEVPLATYPNAMVAFSAMGVKFSYDEFHDRSYIEGRVLESHVGQVTDAACLLLRAVCRERFGFDPGIQHTWDAVNMLCRMNTFHPVRDYFESIAWLYDNVSRIDTMLIDYFGVEDTPLARKMSRLHMTASVRRIRKPGIKYDYMPVLVGPENKAKSLAIQVLYASDNFSDQKIIGIDDKQLAELIRGRWAIEAAELAGMRKADIDALKSQLSRQVRSSAARLWPRRDRCAALLRHVGHD